MEIRFSRHPFGVKLQNPKSGALSNRDSEQTTSVNFPADFAKGRAGPI